MIVELQPSHSIPKRFRLAESRLLPLAVILVTLATLGGVILVARQYIRDELRSQIAGRDAELLYKLWKRQAALERAELLTTVSEDPEALQVAILQTSEGLDRVIGIRLYPAEGGQSLVAFPLWVQHAGLLPRDLTELRRLKPLTHFDLPKEKDFLVQIEPKIPLLDVFIPLHREGETVLLGVAQIILDGTGIAKEFAALEDTLSAQAWRGFLGGGFMVTLSLIFAFRQLRKSNRLLAERTRRLLEANRELTLAAKTSAIGSVSAHLIHGLKNPLSGLQSFMSALETPPANGTDTEWQTAILTTQRMQDLVRDVVRVLAEEKGEFGYEVNLEELVGMVQRKAGPMAEQAGVRLSTRLTATGALMNREANLVLLILENLIANAIQATPRQKGVTLSVFSNQDQIICEVSDQGPGFPDEARAHLFKPCQSRKDGGSGIGLAISKQLANYIGAALELKRSSSSGCVFELVLPGKLCNPQFSNTAAGRE